MKTLHRPFQFVLSLLLVGWLVTGCQPETPVASRPVVTEPHNESRLRNGDQITIRIDAAGNQVTSSDSIIDENGEISLPLINRVKAAGLTPAQLGERIQAMYVPRYYVNLNVTVLATMRFFYVGGEVRNPGRFNWSEDVTLLKAINMSSGFTDYANRGKVQLSRGNKNQTFNAEDLRQHPDKDFMIQPGDSIYVPRSIF